MLSLLCLKATTNTRKKVFRKIEAYIRGGNGYRQFQQEQQKQRQGYNVQIIQNISLFDEEKQVPQTPTSNQSSYMQNRRETIQRGGKGNCIFEAGAVKLHCCDITILLELTIAKQESQPKNVCHILSYYLANYMISHIRTQATLNINGLRTNYVEIAATIRFQAIFNT